VGAGRPAYGPAVKAGPLPCADRVVAAARRRAARLIQYRQIRQRITIDHSRVMSCPGRTCPPAFHKPLVSDFRWMISGSHWFGLRRRLGALRCVFALGR